MAIPTRLYAGTNDLTLVDWTIIEIDDPEEPRFGRHIFGWCHETRLFQISSKILEDQPEYIRTKTRKYFKDGEECKDLPLDATAQLVDFVWHYWGLGYEVAKGLVYKHSGFELLKDGSFRRDPDDNIQ